MTASWMCILIVRYFVLVLFSSQAMLLFVSQ